MTRAPIVGILAIATTIVAAQTPPRDVARITMTGAASVAGSVVADDSQHGPLRHAIVTLSRTGVEDIRTTTTDEQGTFVFDQLPAGTYTLGASKGGYIGASFGALQPGMPGTPIPLIDGQQFSGASISLIRGGVISGRLTDPSGRPRSGTLVEAAQYVTVNGELQQRNTSGFHGSSRTNAHGDYRIFGLLPGEYLVSLGMEFPGVFNTELRPTMPEDSRWAAQPAGPAPAASRPFTFAPTLYPGVVDPAAATKIVLARGEERAGIDFALQAVPVATVSGIVVNMDGQPAVGAAISLAPKIVNPVFFMLSSNLRTDRDGHFVFRNVMPGVMSLLAQTRPDSGAATSIGPTWGKADVQVRGEDVRDLVIRLQPGVSFSGRLNFLRPDHPPDWSAVRVLLIPTQGVSAAWTGSVRPDGTFVVPGLIPGPHRLLITAPFATGSGATWFLRSVAHNGRDLLDTDVTIEPNQDVSGVVVTFVDAPSGIHGHISDRSGAAAPQFYVFVFPEDRSLWTPWTRRIRSTRANSAGDYTLEGLPPGTYRLCALSELDASIQTDPGFLEQLTPASLRVTLGEGERKVQDLRIGG